MKPAELLRKQAALYRAWAQEVEWTAKSAERKGNTAKVAASMRKRDQHLATAAEYEAAAELLERS